MKATLQKFARMSGAAMVALTLAFGGMALGEVVAPTQATAKVLPAKAKSVKRKAIGKKKALEIALKHAGLKRSQVRDVKVKLDVEDGRKIYEVEFEKGAYEYDYDIDRYTGRIIEYEIDRD